MSNNASGLKAEGGAGLTHGPDVEEAVDGVFALLQAEFVA